VRAAEHRLCFQHHPGRTDLPFLLRHHGSRHRQHSGWKTRYYASADTTITASDYFLWEAVADFGIAAGQQIPVEEESLSPSHVPAGQYYIGWILDPDKQICEFNENNNTSYIRVRLTVGHRPR
jgi:hypothetical protein